MSIKKLTALFALLALAACDVEKEELETLTLELNASSEDIDYGTTVTLSWSSNASQCYTSGAYWSGERPTTGTEDFDIKRGGPAVFIMECRRNNEFINQAVEINVNKTIGTTTQIGDFFPACLSLKKCLIKAPTMIIKLIMSQEKDVAYAVG